jgi:hypothetical protein
MEDCDDKRERRARLRPDTPETGGRKQPPGSRNKTSGRRALQAQVSSVIVAVAVKTIVCIVSIALLLPSAHLDGRPCCVAAVLAPPSPVAAPIVPNEHQLVGQAGDGVRLPCLIGKRAHCGEPYFIAWYKLNATSRQWTRIEARHPGDDRDEHEQDDQWQVSASSAPSASTPAPASGRPIAERVQFVWSRAQSPLCWMGAGSNRTALLNNRFQHQAAGGQQQQQQQHQTASSGSLPLMATVLPPFDCAMLTIRPLELQDEGQYKCEITFSETVEFDKCPASTTTQLSVIGEYYCCRSVGLPMRRRLERAPRRRPPLFALARRADFNLSQSRQFCSHASNIMAVGGGGGGRERAPPAYAPAPLCAPNRASRPAAGVLGPNELIERRSGLNAEAARCQLLFGLQFWPPPPSLGRSLGWSVCRQARFGRSVLALSASWRARRACAGRQAGLAPTVPA